MSTNRIRLSSLVFNLMNACKPDQPTDETREKTKPTKHLHNHGNFHGFWAFI